MAVKKLFSGFWCAVMILSNFTFAYAAEETALSGTRNYNLVSEDTQDLYADFPMVINSSIGMDMSLSIQFRYLKNILPEDYADITITDLSTNSVIESYHLTSGNDFIAWGDVENEKHFLVTITQSIGNIKNIYTGYIETKFVPADFPVNIKLSSKEYYFNKGEEFSCIAMKKVGVNTGCYPTEDEDCVSTYKTSGVIDLLDNDGLITFYSY